MPAAIPTAVAALLVEGSREHHKARMGIYIEVRFGLAFLVCQITPLKFAKKLRY